MAASSVGGHTVTMRPSVLLMHERVDKLGRCLSSSNFQIAATPSLALRPESLKQWFFGARQRSCK